MGLQELRAGSQQGFLRPKMGLQELRKSCGWQPAWRGFETQDGLTGAAGWQTQDGLTRAAGWQPAGVLRPKMGLQELRAGSPQGF